MSKSKFQQLIKELNEALDAITLKQLIEDESILMDLQRVQCLTHEFLSMINTKYKPLVLPGIIQKELKGGKK